MSVIRLTQYYLYQGNIYQQGVDRDEQTAAYKAYQMGASLIRADEKANRLAQTQWDSTYTSQGMTLMTDPWFWLSIHLIDTRHLWGIPPGGSGLNSGLPGNGNGEGAAICMLIMAIVILVFSFFAALGFAVDAGCVAKKMHKRKEEVEKLVSPQGAQPIAPHKGVTPSNIIGQGPSAPVITQISPLYHNVQAVYQSMLPILEHQYRNQAFKATLHAVLAVGFGLLTAAAALALYCVIKHIPIPDLTVPLTISGGAILGGVLIGHGIRALGDSGALKPSYRPLFHHMAQLRRHIIHPSDILQNIPDNNVCFIVKDQVFIKSAGVIRRGSMDQWNQLPNQIHYKQIELENRS